MPDIQFGWVVPLEGSSGRSMQPLLVALEKESLPAVTRRFDSLWVYDHFYGFADHNSPYLESWTTLTWLAARYPDVLVGPMVLGVGYRNPALLAKMGATLQTLSGGRFVLGIGAGWREAEYRAYGYTFERRC